MNVTRSGFLVTGAAVGGGALLGSRLASAQVAPTSAELLGEAPYVLMDPRNILYTTCLQCNTQCTLKSKVQDGALVKIDGNPYSPMGLSPQMKYGTTAAQAARVDASICVKGQTGVQTLYDPYRLCKVLKRAGPRGSGRWEAIDFDRAVTEIVEGGDLFSSIGEHRHVDGFREVWALRDPKTAKALATDAAALRAKKMTIAEFKAKNSRTLDLLIDPEHPDLGPKNNQFIFMGGRIAPDRELLAQRFTYGALGSMNYYAHTSICEQAHHIAFLNATAQYKEQKGKYSWALGTNQMKPDYTQSEFVIFWGTGAFEANFGPTPLARQITQSLVDGGLKIAVVDPRLSKTAAKGWWIPVKPSGDNALAMGMIRWIVEQRRYDEAYLRNANKAAATQAGETTWSNATWLVDTKTGALLRADRFGIGTADQFVALVAGRPVALTPTDIYTPIVGDLEAATTLNGIPVKTAFTLLKEAAFAHDVAFYARKSGVQLDVLVALAREFTAHGKKAAIDFYRGAIKHTNGYYTGQAIITLNLLIGNVDWRGGLVPGGGAYDAMGGKPGRPFDMSKLHPGALATFGVKLTREQSGPYETSTLFARDGYPAKRPWFPFTYDVYQEIIPAAHAQYPYPAKILWLHYGTPALSCPDGHLQIAMMQDVERIPLFIATDMLIGDSSMYADYIFPDPSYLERWATPLATSPVTLTRTTKIRQPAAAPLTDIVTIDGERMPIGMDAVMIAIAKRLGASGFGKHGFAPGMPFDRLEDFYLKYVANVATDGTPVPDATPEEQKLFKASRAHLTDAVFDEPRWRAAVGDHLWPKVVYVLARGGRFEAADEAYAGNHVKHTWGQQLDLYAETIALGRNSITGKPFSGIATYEPIVNIDGSLVIFPDEFDLRLFTYKEVFGGHSRTSSNYAGQLALMPENFIYLSKSDGHRLGLSNDDFVAILAPSTSGAFKVGGIESGTSRVAGRIRLIAGIRPGTTFVSWHYGHWAYGSRAVMIDGIRIPGDPRRGTGLVPNPAMTLDRYVKDVSLMDPIAGDAVFFDSKVRLTKVSPT